MYKIYEDEKHHLGLISEDGTHKTPALYDEIKIVDGKWLCRAYKNWDEFNPYSGTFTWIRWDIVEDSNGNIVDVSKRCTTLQDRRIYDSIKQRIADGYIHIYENGKFGINRLDGTVLLEPIYDEIDVWKYRKVIYARKANNHMHFNDKAERISVYSTEETLVEIMDILYQRGIESGMVFIIIVAMQYEEQAQMYIQWLRENPKEMNASKLVGKIIDLQLLLVGHQ